MFSKRHYQKRSTNIVFVIFRLFLSMFMFAVLLIGAYSAYKHFSGLDPLKLDPLAVFNNVIAARTPKQFLDVLSSLKIDPNVLGKSVKTDNPVVSNNTEGETAVRAPGADPAIGGADLSFRFLLVADSHNDNANLNKAIDQAKNKYSDIKFIIGLGDYTDVGTVSELKEVKKVFDRSTFRYFLIPGDHDLWDCRNREVIPTSCFNEVFGPSYQSFVFNNFVFLLINNSDNYKGFDSEQLRWVNAELEKAGQEQTKGIFVFLHTPLYHPSSDHIMGWVEKELKSQAGGLLFQLKEAGAAKVFTGDIHYFSQYAEPKTGISMVTVGAVTTLRNPQVPRFGIVSVFEDGSTKVEDVEIR